MPVLIGFTALGTEVGLWYLERRDLQTAADVGAIAGAFEILQGTDDEEATAEREAVRHGLSLPSGTILVNNPPSSGASAGDDDAVEVLLTQQRTPLFAGMFMGEPVDIAVRAVARMTSSGDACVLALDPTAYRAVDVAGTANLQMGGCVLAANSNNAQAVSIRGNATVRALTLATSGDYRISGLGSLVTELPPRTGATPVSNPYADREIPSFGACGQSDYHRTSATPVTISAGVYCGGMDFGALSVVNFAPGTYIVNRGDFSISGGATITCTGCTGSSGVTIVLTGSGGSYATASISGNADVTLKAPSSGSLAGMLFFQDPNAPSGTTNRFNGGSTANLSGALYFPNQNVEFSGNTANGGASCTQIVASTVSFTGTSNIGADCDDSGVETISTGGTVKLVE